MAAQPERTYAEDRVIVNGCAYRKVAINSF